MKETKFIEQNQEKWAAYESMINKGQGDPEKLNDLFVQITDDLSYARTFYPNRSVKVYLNQLAQRIFNHIYKGRTLPKRRLIEFWTDQLPQVLWESRYALRLAFSLFLLAFCIGVISSLINPEFARTILGDEYVNMTLSNIEKGDPMAVYKEHRPLGLSLGIAANNLFVAFQTAILGVLGSIGTVFFLVYNGIMLGAFQYFFIEKGLFRESFLTIWIHGTLEISAIIIAGGAGLMAGSGLLFPGTFTRTQAFQISVRRGLKIFIGTIPLFLIAAFFEGFLTRFTETPDVLRGLFILMSLAFVLGYYVILPRFKAKRGHFQDTMSKDADLPPDAINSIVFTAIKSSGEVIMDTFTLVKKHLRLTFAATMMSALACTLYAYTHLESANAFGYLRSSGIISIVGVDFEDTARWITYALLLLTALAGYRMIENEMPLDQRPIYRFDVVAKAVLIVLSFPVLTFLLDIEVPLWNWMLCVLIFPRVAYWMAAVWYETRNPLHSLKLVINTYNDPTPFFVGILIVGLMTLFATFTTSGIWKIVMQLFSWAVPPGAGNMQVFSSLFITFSMAAALYFCWLLLVVAGGVYYFSRKEITEATHLQQQIQSIGIARQIRGLPKE